LLQGIKQGSGVARNLQFEGGMRQEGLGAKPPASGDICNFSIKITHCYAYFGQNSYFKAITHQLKAFKKQSKRTK